MKIAYDHQTFSLQRYGGISRYFVKLAEQLDQLEQEVNIFAPLHQNQYLSDLPKSMVTGHGIDRFPRKTTRAIRYANRTIAHMQMVRWKPDIIHQTYYGGLNLKSSKTPVVVTVYDMIHELFPESMRVTDRTARAKKAAIKNADHVICISENTKRDMLEILDVCESKVSVVHLGIDNYFSDANFCAASVSEYQPYILYVGSRGGYKNFSSLLKAFARTPKLKKEFKLVTFGGGKFSRHELDEIQSLGLNDSQILPVSGDDSLLQTYYENASAFVYPSLYEGFGLPPLEAMSAGCPVVSSNTSSMPEVISDAAEFFNPEDIECFAQALEAVVYSEERRADLVVRGYKRVRALSWNKCAQQTLNVYEKLR